MHPAKDPKRRADWLAKISKTLTGRKLPPRTPEHCAAQSESLKGHLVPKEVRDKISKKLTGVPRTGNFAKGVPRDPRGPRNGVEYVDPRQTKQALDWTYSVKVRDNFTCQECRITQKELDEKFRLSGKQFKTVEFVLHAHHIKSWDEFPDLRFDVDNGLTLCISCHSRVHYDEKLMKGLAL